MKAVILKYKKFLLAALISSIFMWLIAGLWHEIVMASFYTNESHATHEGTGIIFLGYIVLGLLMSYIYPLGYKRGNPIFEGMKFGVIIGLIWVFPHDLTMAGAHGTSIIYVLKNAAWHVVEQGFGGVIIAKIYGKDFNSVL